MKISEQLRSIDPRYLVVGTVITFILGYSIPYLEISQINDDLVLLETELTRLDNETSALGMVIIEKNEEIDALQIQITQLENEKSELEKNVPPPENKAPDFTVTCLDGSTFTLSEYQGKIVLLEFMTTWCGYCSQQIVHLQTVHEKFGEDVVIVSISLNTAPGEYEALREYFEGIDATWRWAGHTGNMTTEFNVRSIPTNIVIDRMGYIWARYVGLTDASILQREIEQLDSYWGPTRLTSSYVTISTLDSKKLIDTTVELTILDCRTIEEYVEEHIEGALNIPLQELPGRIGELDANRVVLVYCKAGVRSTEASQILFERGFSKIYNMDGGITAWKNAGLPIVMIPP